MNFHCFFICAGLSVSGEYVKLSYSFFYSGLCRCFFTGGGAAVLLFSIYGYRLWMH